MTVDRKALRVRLEPNGGQSQRLARAAGARRFVFNWALARWREHYATTGKTISMSQLSAELTALKREPDTAWLCEIDSQLLQQALADVKRAFTAFFEGGARYPRFKARKRDQARFRVPQRVKVTGRRVYVPKVGHVRMSEPLDMTGLVAKSATFKQTATGHWYMTLVVEFERPDARVPVIDGPSTVGVDAGLTDLLVLSDGERVANPRWYRSQQRKLARAQRAFSRREKGSANRVRARRRVARVHERTANRRSDFLHKLTTGLVERYDTIIIEDLNLEGLARTKLGKSFHDAAHGEIRRQIAYKAAWSGKNLVVIDRWYPSSKTCGSCGTVNQELTLADRAWACACGAVHDRDLNAARNIRTEGLRQHQSSSSVAVGNTETLNACGGRVRRPTGATAATRHPAQEARTPRL